MSRIFAVAIVLAAAAIAATVIEPAPPGPGPSGRDLPDYSADALSSDVTATGNTLD